MGKDLYQSYRIVKWRQSLVTINDEWGKYDDILKALWGALRPAPKLVLLENVAEVDFVFRNKYISM